MIDVALDDPPVLAVNKPTGLLTEAPEGIDSLVARVKRHLRQEYDKAGNVYLGVPHRLDRAVSGVVLFARNSKAARRLAEQFRDRQIKKTYLALLAAPIEPPSGTLIDWLEKVPDKPVARVVDSFRPGARECILHYRTLRLTPAGALVEIDLGTGRFHQIRVQCAERGRPIVGDTLYGSDQTLDADQGEAIALHAWRLRFLHPVRYDQITAEAPPPAWALASAVGS